MTLELREVLRVRNTALIRYDLAFDDPRFYATHPPPQIQPWIPAMSEPCVSAPGSSGCQREMDSGKQRLDKLHVASLKPSCTDQGCNHRIKHSEVIFLQ